MRRLVALVVAGIACAVPVGCCTHACDGCVPVVQQDQLLEQSETLRLGDEKRNRGADGPTERSDPKVVRIHGGIL